MIWGWLKARIKAPLLGLLNQGLTPDKIALSLAAGLAFGIFPIIGTTTLLCFLACWAFGLNIVAIQLANHGAYLLQLALIIPLLRLGEALCRSKSLTLSLKEIALLFNANFWGTTTLLWRSGLHAIVGWFVVGPLAGACVYLIGRPVLRRLISHPKA